MIAATGSGVGKTTITCALLAALKKEYADVRSFKCGPDYIDPLFHKAVLGIPSKNLDLFFTDEDKTRQLFYRDNSSDISLVEGVMGLYDGIDSESYEGSSYHLASVLNIPIILVVDAHGMGRSILAVIKGFLDMDEHKIIKGVILNRISKGYYETIKEIIEKEIGIRVYGYYPKQEGESIGSRYLGLKLPSEIQDLKESIDKAADTIAATVDVKKLLSDAVISADVSFSESTYGKSRKARIAIARDEAFCFYYEDNLRLLERLGAELVDFSPIHDKKLPENIQGIIIGGGYPELHAKALADNQTMRESVKEAILDRKIPSLAECGGFMYLHKYIRSDETLYDMVGVIDGECYNTGKLVRFGYINIRENSKHFLDAESVIRGHEFHYYDSNNNGYGAIAAKPKGKRQWDCGHIGENHWWGFAHLYYESNPDFIKNFINKCKGEA